MTPTTTTTPTTSTSTTTPAYIAPHFSTSVLVAGVTASMTTGSVILNAGSYVVTGTSNSFLVSLASSCNVSASLGSLTNPIIVTNQSLLELNFAPSGNTSGTISCSLLVQDSNGIGSSVSVVNVFVLNSSAILVITVALPQTVAVLSATPLAT